MTSVQLMRTRWLAPVVVLTVLAALTGCTPGLIGAAGLQRTGDHLAVVVVTCGDASLETLTLRDLGRVNEHSEYAVATDWTLERSNEGVAQRDIGPASDLLGQVGGGQFMLFGELGGLVPMAVLGPSFGRADIDALPDGSILSHSVINDANVVLDNQRAFSELVQTEYCTSAE